MTHFGCKKPFLLFMTHFHLKFRIMASLAVSLGLLSSQFQTTVSVHHVKRVSSEPIPSAPKFAMSTPPIPITPTRSKSRLFCPIRTAFCHSSQLACSQTLSLLFLKIRRELPGTGVYKSFERFRC